MYTYRIAEVLRIIDGDTLLTQVDLGFDVTFRQRIRLTGLNAPELATLEGQAARDWVLAWFDAHPGPYTVTTRKDRRDDYGRYLGVVTAADGHELNADLLAAGVAQAYPAKVAP